MSDSITRERMLFVSRSTDETNETNAYAEIENEICKRYRRSHTCCAFVNGLGFFRFSRIDKIRDGGEPSGVISLSTSMPTLNNFGAGEIKVSTGLIATVVSRNAVGRPMAVAAISTTARQNHVFIDSPADEDTEHTVSKA